MKILFENDAIVIAEKPCGVLSEQSPCGDDAVSVLSRETSSAIYPVHRLDRAVGGVMLFAKSAKAASVLSTDGAFEKEYIAVVHGDTDASGELTDLLFKDSRTNKSYVVKRMRRGVRKARLEYKTLAAKNGLSFVSVRLLTGRSHQIRVQFSSRRHPVVGDGKYGASDGCDIALFLRKIVIPSFDGESISASSRPDTARYPWSEFSGIFDEVDKV
ncbi:MAG: RNA pseudouridine synthase [Clostridia bacterium]|nr:RNA pseudouridine synthase [Clostridia bacterium]